MPPAPESSAAPAETAVANDYDSFAEAYSAENATGLINAYYERPAMLELARQRLGDDADLRVADLDGPLPFADDTFDDVIASLVLHYLEDWGPALAELRRVLKPGGRLIASVDHPFAIALMHREAGREADYFGTSSYATEWTMGGQAVPMSFWHRPLHAMTDAFAAAGFRIAVISEPAPASSRRGHPAIAVTPPSMTISAP